MKLKDLPSIKSMFTIISKAMGDTLPAERLIYEGDNMEIEVFSDKVITLGINSREKISNDSFIARNTTPEDQAKGFEDGRQYHRVKYFENVAIKIYGDKDFVLDSYERIDGLLNGNFSEAVFKKFGVQIFPLNDEDHLNLEIGGKITKCLLLRFNMVYSLIKDIQQDGDILLYNKFKIDQIKIEE